MVKSIQDKKADTFELNSRTNYGKGMIEGHYVGRKTASYLKNHTRCTKGHGWTLQGEFGGCAQCEKEEE